MKKVATFKPWPDVNLPTTMLGRWPDRQRFYKTPDGDLPSVTTILKVLGLGTEGLIRWSADTEREAVLEAAYHVHADLLGKRASVGKENFQAIVRQLLGKERAHVRQLQKAADIGTQVHERIQWTIYKLLGQETAEPKLDTDQAEWAFMAWQDWWNGCGYRPVKTEQPVYFAGDDRIGGYAGTLDLLVEDPDGLLWIVDTKSSKGIYLEHHLQQAMYLHAARQHAKIAGAKIVRVPKKLDDPEFEVVELGEFTTWDGNFNPKTFDELLDAAAGTLTAFNVLLRAA